VRVRVELGELAVDAPRAPGECERSLGGRRTVSLRATADTSSGAQWTTMIGFLVLLFPVVLLGFLLVMERVEQPLDRVAVERDIEQFLDDANAEEIETFVREGTDSALTRFRQRLGFGRLRGNVRPDRVN